MKEGEHEASISQLAPLSTKKKQFRAASTANGFQARKHGMASSPVPRTRHNNVYWTGIWPASGGHQLMRRELRLPADRFLYQLHSALKEAVHELTVLRGGEPGGRLQLVQFVRGAFDLASPAVLLSRGRARCVVVQTSRVGAPWPAL
jgi:hypothetical protein